MENLPEKEGYKLTKYYLSIFSAIIFFVILAFFMIFAGLFDSNYMYIVGTILAGIISIAFHLYQKKTSPGQIQHFVEYQKQPTYLNGNKFKEDN